MAFAMQGAFLGAGTVIEIALPGVRRYIISYEMLVCQCDISFFVFFYSFLFSFHQPKARYNCFLNTRLAHFRKLDTSFYRFFLRRDSYAVIHLCWPLAFNSPGKIQL